MMLKMKYDFIIQKKKSLIQKLNLIEEEDSLDN